MENYVQRLQNLVLTQNVQSAMLRGGQVVVILARMPKWLSKSSNDTHRLPSDPFTTVEASAPKNYDTWAQLVSNTVQMINRNLGADARYELWNEPNSQGFWQGTMEEYLQMYRYTVKGARQADPAAKVGGPAVSFYTASIGTNTSPLIRELVRYAAATPLTELGLSRLPVDFLTWHEFGTMPDVTLSNRANDVRGWIAEAGITTPVKLLVDEWQIVGFNQSPISDPRRDTEFAAAYGAAMIAGMANARIDGQCMAAFQDFASDTNMFIGDYGSLTRFPEAVRKSSYHLHEILDQFATRRVLPAGWTTALSEVQRLQLGSLAVQTPRGLELLLWSFTAPSNMYMFASSVRIIDEMRVQDPAALQALLDGTGASSTAELVPFIDSYLIDPTLLNPINMSAYWKGRFSEERGTALLLTAALNTNVTVRVEVPAYATWSGTYTHRIIDRTHANAFRAFEAARPGGMTAAINAAVANQALTVNGQGPLLGDGFLPALLMEPQSVHWITLQTNAPAVATTTTTSSTTLVSSTSTTTTTTTSSTTTVPKPPVGGALEQPGLIWARGGAAAWYGQSTVSHDGMDAARSGTIGHNQDSWMQTVFTGPTTIGFFWKTSSEVNDTLILTIDGVEKLKVGGERDWTWMGTYLEGGSHTLRWTYVKNGSGTAGADAAWVDQASGGLFGSAVDLGSGWRWSPWFGYVNTVSSPWFYHQQHGWLYAFGQDVQDLTFWDSEMTAFWWTRDDRYPYVYRFDDAEWLWYLRDSDQPRWFLKLSTGVWEGW
jgi:hypothetical protein